MDLLLNGASPDLCREDGWSPLHAAARFGHSGTAIALLEEGRADFEARTGDHGSTPLHVAAISGFDEVYMVLLFLVMEIVLKFTDSFIRSTQVALSFEFGKPRV